MSVVLVLTLMVLWPVKVIPRSVSSVNVAVVLSVPPPRIMLSASVEPGDVPKLASELIFRVPALMVVPE